MAITPFDQPAQSTFISTYSPVPFNELMQAGAMKAKQYESGLENLMQTYEDTNNLKYIPNSKDEEYIKSVVVPHTKQIVDKYSNQDLSDPIIRRQMRMELNNGIDKQRIKDIQNSFEGYKQYVGEKMKLQQKNMLSPLEGTPHQNWDTSTQGTFQHLPSEWSDPIKGLQDRYFQGLETQVLRDKRGNPISDPRGYYTSAITANRIGQETETNLDNALATPDGQRAVALYRHQYNIPNNVSDRDILRQAMLSAGHKFIQDKTEGSPYQEWMFKEKGNDNYGQFYKNERTPMLDVNKRDISSDKFKPRDAGDFVLNKDYSWWNPFESAVIPINKGEKAYDITLLDKPEVQNIIKLMPKEYRDRAELLKSKEFRDKSPEQYTRIQKDIFNKLENTYRQIEQEVQQGPYLQAYYPKAIDGIPESKLNNVENVTKYIFKTDELDKVGSGVISNREFLNLKTGEAIPGKIFYDKVISKLVKNEPNGLIAVTGEYEYQHPFVAMTGNSNFAKSYQVVIGGDEYIMSGEAGDYTDPLDRYKRNANISYSLVKFNPAIPIDENDGTLKVYNNGIYSILDKDSNEIIAESENFTKAYNDSRLYLKNKNKK